MNYEQKCTLYEEAKSSLNKFKGDDGGQKEKSAIKLKPAYLAENEEALLAAGYVKAKGKNFDSRRGPRRERGDDLFETRATEVSRKIWVQGKILSSICETWQCFCKSVTKKTVQNKQC